MIWSLGKHKPTPAWVTELIQHVIERDEGLCVICGAQAVDAHHVIPRSRGKRWSAKIWREENMACTCRLHHKHTSKMRMAFIAKMVELYAYDMGWVKEFGIALEESNGLEPL